MKFTHPSRVIFLGTGLVCWLIAVSYLPAQEPAKALVKSGVTITSPEAVASWRA